jgi:periplasmic divalent cation tolerance protein
MPLQSTAMTDRPVLIMVTAGGRDEAERIGEGLVVDRLAACTSVVPTVHSFYFQEGLLKRDHEALLLIKTVESRVQGVQDYVRAHHSYTLPEFITMNIDGGSPDYLQWLVGQVGENPR